MDRGNTESNTDLLNSFDGPGTKFICKTVVNRYTGEKTSCLITFTHNTLDPDGAVCLWTDFEAVQWYLNVRDKCFLESCGGYMENTISNCMMRMDKTTDCDRYQ